MSGKKEKTIYKRILLKLSGESLLGKQSFGVDPDGGEFYSRRNKICFRFKCSDWNRYRRR